MRCYISGPMRGKEDNNFPAFDAAKERLISLGYEVVSPADADRRDRKTKTQLDYAKRDTAAILGCDTMCLLYGWEDSVGATAEFFLARWIGLKIINEYGKEFVDAFKDFCWENSLDTENPMCKHGPRFK
jgi:Domain of unknown function (DUF4406)